MTNSSLMCWPRGNDVSLTVYLYEPQVDEHGIPVHDQQGNIVWEPVDVDAYDEWRVRVKTDEYILLSSAAGATAGTLVVKVPGTFPCGVYAVEFTGMKNGFAVRSFETTMFGIVESNGDANVTFDIVDGERSCDIDIKIQMVPFSVERGKNAYELWKEQPGNEDKTLQDYLDSLEPVQADWTEADPDDKAFIKHKPTLAAVATSGDYGDLLNKPITTLPSMTNLDTVTRSGLYYVTEYPNSLLVVFTPYPGYTNQCLVTGEGKLKSRAQSNGQWSAWSEPYYIKPSGGIPKSDLASAVQASLGKADTALQSQTQVDWDATTGVGSILNKPTLSTVATSGNYNDLTNKPTIPTVPEISTNITTDATSDTKTASPKAVKTYVDTMTANVVYSGTSGSASSASFDPQADTVHVTEQSLSSAQQQQARTNIGAGTSSFSGSYSDLTNKPTIPDAVSGTNDGTNWTSLTIGSTTKAIPSGGGGGGGEANVIESISINGTTQTVTSKNVDLPVPTSTAVYQIVSISQSAYDALVSGGTVSSTTLYLITS